MTSTPGLVGLSREETGGVLAENALVLPIMLLILFAMVYFGLLTYTHIVVQLAAAQGARVGAAAYADDPNGTKTPTPDEKARGFVRSVIQSGLDLNDLDAVEVTGDEVEGESAIRVTVAYRFKLLVPFMSEWGASTTAGSSGVRVVRSAIYRVETVSP